MRVTGQLQYDAWQARVMPPVETLGPGLWSVPVPIPDSPLRYVSVYVLELRDGIALIDAGWPTDDAWRSLTDGLATIGFQPSDARAVLITHMHADHHGLAGRVREASGAWIGMHAADAAALAAHHDLDSLVLQVAQLNRIQGVPVEESSVQVRRFQERMLLTRMADPDVLLDDDQLLDLPGWNLRTVWTPGHSPGHLCFIDPDRRRLFSGDHVLPRITSNISVHPTQTSNPLADYLRSLEKVARLDVDEVLPAHEYRFAGLADRTAALAEHHEERLAEVVAALRARPGQTSWDLSAQLTWSRPWEQIDGLHRRVALGETMAHLVELERRGDAVRTGDDPAHWGLTPVHTTG